MTSNSYKEPWLAVNLSSLFPGLGEIYSGKRDRGFLIIISNLTLLIFSFLSIILPNGNVLFGLALLLTSGLIGIGSLFHAYNCANSINKNALQYFKQSNKDPWLAIFLTRILPGLGHIYMGQWSIGILGSIFFLLTLFTIPLFSSKLISSLTFLLFIFHVYYATPLSSYRRKSVKTILVFSILLVALPFYITIFRIYFFETRYIPAGSMEPALQINDRVVIEKLSYHFRAPGRGDIVVFNPTVSLKKANFEEAFIKRVIGIPGDRVEIKNEAVWVNDQPMKENYTDEGVTGHPSPEHCRNNFLTSDLDSQLIKPPVPIFLAKPQTIPDKHYLVLGDNRGNSYDGRCWGLVSHNDLVGRATSIFYPFNRVSRLDNPIHNFF